MKKSKSATVPARQANFLSAPETRILEGVNLAAFAWWTLLLLIPSAHLFTQPAFSALAAWGTERSWGLWTLMASLMALLGMCAPRPAWRVLALAAGAALWLFVTGLLAEGAAPLPVLGILLPRSTGVGVYLALSVASFLCGWRLRAYFFADIHCFFALRRKPARQNARS